MEMEIEMFNSFPITFYKFERRILKKKMNGDLFWIVVISAKKFSFLATASEKINMHIDITYK